jgi:hypothetical protein
MNRHGAGSIQLREDTRRDHPRLTITGPDAAHFLGAVDVHYRKRHSDLLEDAHPDVDLELMISHEIPAALPTFRYLSGGLHPLSISQGISRASRFLRAPLYPSTPSR